MKVHDSVVTELREQANKTVVQNSHSDARDRVSFIETVAGPLLAIKNCIPDQIV